LLKASINGAWKFCWGVVLLAAILLHAQPCHAEAQLTKYDITIPAGESHEGPFFAAGKEIIIDGKIKGDLYAVGTNVVVNGTVHGDLLVVSATLKVNGVVKGDVRSLSATANINGQVDGNVSYVGRQLVLTSSGIIDKGLLLVTMQGEVNGSVQNKVCGWGSNIKLGGNLGGGVTLYKVGSLAIEQKAKINGPVRYTGANSADVSPGAALSGKLHWERKEAEGGSLFMTLLWFLAGVLVWYSFNFILPGFWSTLISPALNKPLAAVLWGTTIFLVTPVLVLALLFTLMGIPMALMISGFYVCTLYLGKIIAGQSLGSLFAKRLGWENRFKPFTWFLLGYVVVVLVGSLPYLNSFVGIISVCWAMGVICWAAVLNRRKILHDSR